MRKLIGIVVLGGVLISALLAIFLLQTESLAPPDSATTSPPPVAESAPARDEPMEVGEAEPEPEAEPDTRGFSSEDTAGSSAPGSTPETSANESVEPSTGEPRPTPSPHSPIAKKRAPPSDDWDVVPVYYGTDRAVEANPERLSYSSERGRRLELGRALVTVPKAHISPAIERPWVIRVPYLNITVYEEDEDPKLHFTMKEVEALTEEQFLQYVAERLAASSRYKDHALIFIHGYNTTFDYAIYRAAQISYDLKFDGAAFAYSWPSGGGLASYTYDRESSGQAEPYLRQFIDLVSEKTGAKSVSIIAHSMGNQPALQVLRDLRRRNPGNVKINQIILAAPDVDRDNFENIAAEIQGVANGVTLYAAANDRALGVSRKFYGGIPRAGDVPATGPLVLPGVDTVDATAASMDSLGLNHSGYAENNTLLSDIGLLIQSGQRPPSIRTPALEQVTTDKGLYWRFPPLQR